MSESPGEAAMEAEFNELLEGSTLTSPAAKFIRDMSAKQMEEWAKQQAIRAAEEKYGRRHEAGGEGS